MPNYSMDHDQEYWEVPERFRSLVESLPSIGIRSTYFPLGDVQDDDAPTAVVLQMEPGYVITRHAHPCQRVEVVLRGTIEADDGRTLVPGDVMTADANEFYGPKTAGPEGCTTLEIFSKTIGSFTRISEFPDGSHKTTNILEDQSVLGQGREEAGAGGVGDRAPAGVASAPKRPS